MHEPSLPIYPAAEPFVDAERAAAFVAMPRKTLLDLARKGVAPGHPVGHGMRKV